MSDSGFDTLNTFKTDFSIKPIQPVQPVEGVAGGTFSVADAEQKQVNQAKDVINQDLANQMVDQTPDFNQMALDYAGEFLPVRQASEENASFIAQQMGLGKRVSFDEALAELQSQIGPLPKTKAVDKTFNFLIDSINARTPYKGAAGIFDVLAQSTGKYIDRETAEKTAEIAHNLKMKELAVATMQEQNAAVLEKESEFFLKKMGMDDDYLQKFLGFTQDLQLKAADFEINTLRDKQKAALDLYSNPGRIDQNITYTVGDESTVAASRRVFNPNTGQYEYFLARPGEQGQTIFDVPIPVDPKLGMPNFYFSPKETPQTDAALAASQPNFSQTAEILGDFNTLGRSANILEKMLIEDKKYEGDTGQSRFGIQGAINAFTQETKFTFEDALNAIFPGAGNQLVSEAEKLYERDKINYPLPAGEEEKFATVVIKGYGSALDDLSPFTENDITKTMSIDDFFRPSTYANVKGYDATFARNKVRENLIIYSIARALKPTGRLNVDDIKRASQLVNLQGFKSAEFVRTQLQELMGFLRQGQDDFVSRAQTGDGNFILDRENDENVESYKIYKGLISPTNVTTPPQIAPNINEDVEQSPVRDPEENPSYNGDVFLIGEGT